ncbi:hypothetical protein PGT21_004582 [Puccinia graminis f. sp. tritici]|uniref:Uncharacterized protein n=1 Tax=Puccinia graminis f. sp. tritici TaxID=56615 RepID=A0A5B0PSV8_PUCGR|nr:hypothetical protein PGT21_004582 [Puccinia graminis f. sp. tritici]
MYSIKGSRLITEPISVAHDGTISFTFVDKSVPYANRLSQSNLPSYRITTKPMRLSLHLPGPWLTYYGKINSFSSTGPIEVHAQVSYWQSQCPSFMRSGGSPQISGDFRISSHDSRLVVEPLCPSPMSLRIKCPGFMAIYSDTLEPDHNVWVEGQILRRVSNVLYLHTPIIAPCAHIKDKQWNSRL